MDLNYIGSTAASENGDGNGLKQAASPSMTHAWFIIIGALAVLWLLGGVAFRTVRI